MRNGYRALPIAALLLVGANGQPAFKVGIAIDSPPTLSGNCHPTRVHFSGRINATAPGEATYQWVRSDNAQTPVLTLRFSKPGPLPVSYDWSLSKSATGWVAFRVLSPNQAETKKVGFRLKLRRVGLPVALLVARTFAECQSGDWRSQLREPV